MKEQRLYIGALPAVLYGQQTAKVWLFIHGKQGHKEEAADFARIACSKGAQVLAVDLPGHGEREAEAEKLTPWHMAQELRTIAAYAREHWGGFSVRANSIGAWFSLLALGEEKPERCLFVSPILDMEALINKMMIWAGTDEAQLQSRGTIPTGFGETLSWEYLCYVRQNPVTSWPYPTAILYAGQDNLTRRREAEDFCRRFHCDLTVMEQGEHWFHTPEQLRVLEQWTEENC